MRIAATLTLLGFSFAASANSVSNQLIVTSTQSSASAPRPMLFTNMFTGSLDLNEEWTLTAGANVTLAGNSGSGEVTQQFNRTGAVTLFNLGLDWMVTDNWMVGATIEASPSSTQSAGSPMTVPNPCPTSPDAPDGVAATAEVRSQAAQVGAALDVVWDSAGRSSLEWSITGGVSLAHYGIEQNVNRVQTPGCLVTAQSIAPLLPRYCADHPGVEACTRTFRQAINGIPENLDFARFSAGATATLFLDTDLSVLADGYVYNQDPAQIGSAGVSFLGRDLGLPIAPLRFVVRPEVAHRFGDISAKLWAQAGEYASGTAGSTAAIGARVQYRISTALRAWVSVSGQRDVDLKDNAIKSGTVALGAGYRW